MIMSLLHELTRNQQTETTIMRWTTLTLVSIQLIATHRLLYTQAALHSIYFIINVRAGAVHPAARQRQNDREKSESCLSCYIF